MHNCKFISLLTLTFGTLGLFYARSKPVFSIMQLCLTYVPDYQGPLIETVLAYLQRYPPSVAMLDYAYQVLENATIQGRQKEFLQTYAYIRNEVYLKYIEEVEP